MPSLPVHFIGADNHSPNTAKKDLNIKDLSDEILGNIFGKILEDKNGKFDYSSLSRLRQTSSRFNNFLAYEPNLQPEAMAKHVLTDPSTPYISSAIALVFFKGNVKENIQNFTSAFPRPFTRHTASLIEKNRQLFLRIMAKLPGATEILYNQPGGAIQVTDIGEELNSLMSNPPDPALDRQQADKTLNNINLKMKKLLDMIDHQNNF
jgi:hypothetical protein